LKEKLDVVLVVEGRDDMINIQRFFDCQIIITHGFGISESTFQKIQNALLRKTVIVLTDPDFAGDRIRERINNRFKEVKNAYIPRQDATKGNDVGVENAPYEAIKKALNKVRINSSNNEEIFSIKDLQINNLTGFEGSTIRRDKLGSILGIGYANSKVFLSRLNGYSISREEFESALRELNNE
jgi:ribonuclease M5